MKAATPTLRFLRRPGPPRAPGNRGTGRRLRCALVLCGLLACLGLPSAVRGQFSRRPTVRIDRLDASKPPAFTVQLTDLDGEGRPIVDRKRQNYRLLVDGVPSGGPTKVRRAADLALPMALTLVVQVSPPMREVFTETIEAARRLVDALPVGSRAGLVAYTDVVVQNTAPTDAKTVKQAIDNLRIRDEAVEVHLPDAIRDGLESLNNPRLPPRRAIVVISDGLTAKLTFQVFAELGRRATDKGIAAHTIGFAPLEPSRLRTLFELSRRGGGTFRQAKTGTELERAFAALQEELSGQLVLDYEPSGAFDGKLHDFQIEFPEGHASNIVSLELPAFVESKPEQRWSVSPWLVFLLVGLGVVILTLFVWLLFWMRSRRRTSHYGEDAMDRRRGDEDEDDYDVEDEDDGDGEEGGRETGEHEVEAPAASAGTGQRRHVMHPEVARRNIDQLFAKEPSGGSSLNEPSPKASSQASRMSEDPQISAGSAPQRAPEPFGVAPGRESAATSGGLRHRVGHSALGVEQEARHSSAPLRLPLPQRASTGSRLRAGSAPKEPSVQAPGAVALSELPHPDEYLRQAGGPGDAPPKPSSPLKPPTDFSAPPADDKPSIVPLISASSSGTQPGRLLDRKTSVLAVDEIQEVDFIAWIVAADGDEFSTVRVQDGTTIGSSPECDLVLEDEGLSPNHAQVVLDSRGYRLQTLGTRGGTLTQPLNDGVSFLVGRREFLFKVASRFPEKQLGAARLEVLNGMDRGRALSLQDGRAYVVGSHSSCALVVRGEHVGPRHAVCLRKDRECIVADLGTETGIWHQGEKVGRLTLVPGGEIALGSVRLVFSLEGARR